MHLDVLRAELHRQPFVPFNLRLADGRSLHVKHPDFVALNFRRVIVIDDRDNEMAIIEPLLIVSIDKKFSTDAFATPATNGESLL